MSAEPIRNIYDARGGKVFGDILAAGSGVTLELNAGETYRIDAAQSGKTGEYALAVGKQESASDISGKSIVPGIVTYKDQKKTYTFTAADSGKYRITIGNMQDGCSVKMYVYSQLGDRLEGADEMGSGSDLSEGADEMGSGSDLSVILKEGQGYQLRITQMSGTGNYTITMVKE